MGDREINEQWAAWLRRRMRTKNYSTPTELARASDVDQSVISRWLNEGRTPQVDQLRKVAGPLEASMLDLLVAAGYVTRAEVTGVEAAWAEPTTIDVSDAIESDPTLIEEARTHLLAQYQMLRDLSVLRSSKDTERPKTSAGQKPLRAVARKRQPRKT